MIILLINLYNSKIHFHVSTKLKRFSINITPNHLRNKYFSNKSLSLKNTFSLVKKMKKIHCEYCSRTTSRSIWICTWKETMSKKIFVCRAERKFFWDPLDTRWVKTYPYGAPIRMGSHLSAVHLTFPFFSLYLRAPS